MYFFNINLYLYKLVCIVFIIVFLLVIFNIVYQYFIMANSDNSHFDEFKDGIVHFQWHAELKQFKLNFELKGGI